MKTNRSNFLCGFMGAGKSTILKEIDTKENITCMDLDLHIENLYGPINKIFDDKGESYFRLTEQEEFFEQVDRFDLIALGGGAVENDEIYKHILQSGKAIYLETENKPPQSHIWFKTKEKIRANTPLKHQLLAFASDYSLLLSATLPHRKDFESQKIYYASLDHAPYVSLL